VLDLFFADDFVQRIDDFLDVMQMKVVGAALITRLRPSAHRGAAGLFADDRLFALGFAAKDKNPRLIGVEHHGRIARVVLYDPGQRIEVRDRADEQRVLRNRRVERNDFEELGPAGRKYRDGLAGRVLHLEMLLDALDVFVETLALR
jgi:hypothetical protein